MITIHNTHIIVPNVGSVNPGTVLVSGTASPSPAPASIPS